MAYLEFARVRRAFTWFAGVLVAVAVLVCLGALGGSHAQISVSSDAPGSSSSRTMTLASLGAYPVPAFVIAAIAIVACFALGTALATSFNRETLHAPLAFVRPVSSVWMGLSIVGVDLAALVAMGVFAGLLATITIVIAFGSHAHIVGVGGALGIAFLGLGAAFLWYALLQSASAWPAGRGGAYAVVAAIVLVLAPVLAHQQFLGPLATLFGIVLLVDPIGYVTSIGSGGVTSAVGGSVASHAIEVWLLAIAFVAGAIYLWRRVEV